MTKTENATPPDCPPVAELRRLIRGLVSESSLDSLIAHVTGCNQCNACIQILEKEEDELITAMRQVKDDLLAPSAQLVEIKARLLNLVSPKTAFDGALPETPVEELGFGPFRVLRVLGRGGMGNVYLARHEMMHRLVALKLIHPQFFRTDQRELIARFETEVRAAGQVSDPHLVTAFDAGVIEGQPYLSMEYLAGRNLSQLLLERGPLSTTEVCKIILKAASGIKAAHDAGIIHRDIKPSNIILTDQGDVKVLDLGLALLHGSEGVTTAGQVIGTIQYMAPEQFENARDVDARADVYGLGATAYKLLCGRSPIGDEKRHPLKMLSDLVGRIPERLDDIRADVPRELADLIARTLSKDRSLRPASVEQFMSELKQIVADCDAASGTSRLASKSETPLKNRVHDSSLVTNLSKYLLTSVITILVIASFIYLIQSRHNRPQRVNAPADQSVTSADSSNNVASAASIWNQLSTDSLPAEQRKQPWHPSELVGMIGSESCRQWGSISHLAFSQDEQWLAVTSPDAFDEVLTIRKTADFTRVAGLSRKELFPDRMSKRDGAGWPAGIEFLPDGSLLTADRSGRVCIWKLDAGQMRLQQFFDLERYIHSAVVSPDGGLLVCNDGSTNRLFIKRLGESKSPESEIIADQLKHDRQITLSFSQQSNNLLVHDEAGNVMVWNLDEDLPQLTYTADLGEQDLLNWVAISADGQRLAYRRHAQFEISVRDLQTGSDVGPPIISPHSGPGITFCGGDDSLVADSSGELYLIRTLSTAPEFIKLGNTGDDGLPHKVNLTSRMGTYIAARSHGGGILRLWKNNEGTIREISDPQRSSSWVHHIVFSPDGSKLGTLADVGDRHHQHFETWDVHNHKLANIDSTRFEWAINPRLEKQIRFDSESKGTYAGQFLKSMGSTFPLHDNSYHCWDLRPPRFDSGIFQLQAGILKRLNAPRVHGPGENFSAITWDAHPGKCCVRVTYSPDGLKLATIADDYSLRLWDMAGATPTMISEFKDEGSETASHGPEYCQACYTLDGKRLAFMGKSLWEWDLAEPQPKPLALSASVKHSAAKLIDYSPDGTRMLLGTFFDAGQSVVLWNCKQQRIERSWKLPGVVMHVAYAPDGQHIAWVNANGSAYLLRL